MSLSAQTKSEIVKKTQRQTGDTGSPEVQIALLSARIQSLAGHFQANKKDFHSRRGLLHMVSKRRTLLAYLKRENPARYQSLIEELEIRG